MKLLDLLKSLNNGTAADPDAPEAASPRPQTVQLVDELGAILALLDAPPSTGNTTAQNSSSTHIEPAKNLLNLAAIFDDDSDEAANTANSPPPLPFMPSEPHSPAPDERRQLVQSLLDELLPALEKALNERLHQLDQHALTKLERSFRHRRL